MAPLACYLQPFWKVMRDGFSSANGMCLTLNHILVDSFFPVSIGYMVARRSGKVFDAKLFHDWMQFLTLLNRHLQDWLNELSPSLALYHQPVRKVMRIRFSSAKYIQSHVHTGWQQYSMRMLAAWLHLDLERCETFTWLNAVTGQLTWVVTHWTLSLLCLLTWHLQDWF